MASIVTMQRTHIVISQGIRGILAVPVSLHPPLNASADPVIRVYIWDLDGVACQAIVPYSMLDSKEWVRVGMLEGIVCGLRQGKVLFSRAGVVRTDDCEVLTADGAIEMALRRACPVFPAKWIGIGWDGRWAGFYGFAMIHALAGDGRVGRVHMYSREMEEHPSSFSAARADHDVLSDTAAVEFMRVSTLIGNRLVSDLLVLPE